MKNKMQLVKEYFYDREIDLFVKVPFKDLEKNYNQLCKDCGGEKEALEAMEHFYKNSIDFQRIKNILKCECLCKGQCESCMRIFENSIKLDEEITIEDDLWINEVRKTKNQECEVGDLIFNPTSIF